MRVKKQKGKKKWKMESNKRDDMTWKMNGKRRKGSDWKVDRRESTVKQCCDGKGRIEIGVVGWVLSCFCHVSYVGRGFNVNIIKFFLNCFNPLTCYSNTTNVDNSFYTFGTKMADPTHNFHFLILLSFSFFPPTISLMSQSLLDFLHSDIYHSLYFLISP